MKNCVYVENGYAGREEYLQGLSTEFGIGYDLVAVVADMLGPAEDFDGLVSTLEDFTYLPDL